MAKTRSHVTCHLQSYALFAGQADVMGNLGHRGHKETTMRRNSVNTLQGLATGAPVRAREHSMAVSACFPSL